MKQTFTRYVIQREDGKFLSIGKEPDLLFTSPLNEATRFAKENIATKLSRYYNNAKVKKLKVTIEIE